MPEYICEHTQIYSGIAEVHLEVGIIKEINQILIRKVFIVGDPLYNIIAQVSFTLDEARDVSMKLQKLLLEVME